MSTTALGRNQYSVTLGFVIIFEYFGILKYLNVNVDYFVLMWHAFPENLFQNCLSFNLTPIHMEPYLEREGMK